MEVILVDLVNNNQIFGGCTDEDDNATVHSLSSLVSSDDPTVCSPERQKNSPATKNCDHRPSHRRLSRIYGREIAIIACNSPEIKALVEPSVPQSVQCNHQRTISTLSFLSEDVEDELCGGYGPPTSKLKQRRTIPIVSPDNEHVRTRRNDQIPLSIERRDQDNYSSDGRFLFDDAPTPKTRNSSYKDDVDELAVFLDRQRIHDTYSPEMKSKDVRDSAVPSTAMVSPQGFPTKRRSSMHRRVSYDNLPDISEVLCHPDFR